MSAHAKLGPSAAKRWMTCPGSVRMNAAIPDHGSLPAAQGTLCHEELAAVLAPLSKSRTGQVELREPGKTYHVDGWDVDYTEEMFGWVMQVAGWVQKYLDLHPGAKLFTERQSPVGKEFGHPDVLWGTADIVITNVPDHELVVADAKFGFEEVDVESNEQVSLYAIGVVHEYGWLTFDSIELVILQPRSPTPVKDEHITIDELEDRRDRYRAAVEAALEPAARLVPSDEACKWCRAAGCCPALQGEVKRLAQEEFSDPELLTPEQLAEVLRAAPLAAKAIKAANEYALQLVTIGTPVPGWKRVLSNTHRQWKDVKKAEAALRLLADDPEKLFTPRELISPAQAEKLLKLPAKSMDALAPKPEGKPTLAPESDPRPALAPDFKPE